MGTQDSAAELAKGLPSSTTTTEEGDGSMVTITAHDFLVGDFESIFMSCSNFHPGVFVAVYHRE